MENKKYLTSIQIEVCYAKPKKPVIFSKKWHTQTTVYYDCIELSLDEVRAIIKMNKILTRWIYSIENETKKLKTIPFIKKNKRKKEKHKTTLKTKKNEQSPSIQKSLSRKK